MFNQATGQIDTLAPGDLPPGVQVQFLPSGAAPPGLSMGG